MFAGARSSLRDEGETRRSLQAFLWFMEKNWAAEMRNLGFVTSIGPAALNHTVFK